MIILLNIEKGGYKMLDEKMQAEQIEIDGFVYDKGSNVEDVVFGLDYSQTVERDGDVEMDLFTKKGSPYSVFVMGERAEATEYSMEPVSQLKKMCEMYLEDESVTAQDICDHYHANLELIRTEVDGIENVLIEVVLGDNDAMPREKMSEYIAKVVEYMAEK